MEPVHDIVAVRRRLRSAGWRDAALTVRQVGGAGRPDRAVYDVDGRWFAKCYAPEATEGFLRERAGFEAASNQGRAPAVVYADIDEAQGGLLVTERARGVVLDRVYKDLGPTEYIDMVRDLGVGLATIHALAGAAPDNLPPSRLEADRRADFDEQDRALTSLVAAGRIGAATAATLRAYRAERATPVFRSATVLLHGDVHNENVFVESIGGRFHCTFIDFEDASPGPAELDWVHPALNILGEGYPTRRLAAVGSELFAAFAQGYASMAGTPPDALVIADHALAWYLGKAARVGNDRAARFFVVTALGCLTQATGLAFDELRAGGLG